MAFDAKLNSDSSPNYFLIMNIVLIIVYPLLVVLAAAGAYIVALILGAVLTIGLTIGGFFVIGPYALAIPFILMIIFSFVANCAAGDCSSCNCSCELAAEGVERIAAFLAYAIPAIIAIVMGITVVMSALTFGKVVVKVFGVITAICYLVAAVLLIISAVTTVSPNRVDSGVGFDGNTTAAIFLPTLPRIIYAVFGYIEIK